MRNRKYRFLQFISGLLFIGIITLSCEGFLDQVPGDNITPEQHYRAGIDANISIIGAFSLLQEVVPNLVVLNDLRSDLLMETDNFNSDIREINYNDISINNPYNDPSGFYRIIINANEVLANLEQIQENDLDYDELNYLYDYIDLVSLRSWAYFTLVRLYGEAAYIPDNLSSFSEDQEFEYYSKKDMVNLLIQQLDTLTYPDVFVGGAWGVYDRALRGELYLEKGDYVKAAEHLENAIGGADVIGYKLASFAREGWKDMHVYAISQSREVMTAVPFSYEDIQENPLADLFYPNRNYLVKPTTFVSELFEKQVTKRDESGDLYRGNRISYIKYGPDSSLVVNKYSIDPIESSGSDIIVYRAAHIHLLLAEAYNRLGRHADAMSILNDGLKTKPGWGGSNGVRGRAYLKPKATPSFYVTETIEDMIMEERAMELAFEGHRWFDLVRIANRRGAAYLADRVAAKYDDPAVASAVHDRLMNKSNWYLPFRK